VIDPIWLSPLDLDTIVESTRKTGRLCVVDNDWVTCGASAEIVAAVVERLQGVRPVLVRRMGFAQVTCPPTPTLEDLYYPNARTIAAAAYELVTGGEDKWYPEERPELQEIQFKGPF
jgi:pyruvate/2-oxoglutarate/acetoin dehydrogenase E1 component